MKITKNKTVFLHKAVNGLNINPNGIYIDGTFGNGEHSRLILSKLGKKGRLLAIDRDPKAVSIAKKLDDPRFFIVHGLFSSLDKYVSKYKFTKKISGILLDLGMSSNQLDDEKRGFSFMKDGTLDMRMNPINGKPAYKWLQHANESDIAWIIKTFGEDRFSKRIARAIVRYNKIKPITRTIELAEIVKKVIPIKNFYKHPATRTFQAIRIWINNELKEIELVLKNSLKILSQGGRISIISFHSLEDRIVKQFMCRCNQILKIPTDLPITENQLKKIRNPYYFQMLYKIKPNEKEIKENPRCRSAILRIAEKQKHK